MHHPTTKTLAADWQDCKEAHTAAREQYELERAWGGLMAGAAQPWLDALAEKAWLFKSTHGFEFDPSKPITEPYEAAKEARDFDASVDARTSHMQEA
jgi:hypothetical protein